MQGSTPNLLRPLHWQLGSLPTSHAGSLCWVHICTYDAASSFGIEPLISTCSVLILLEILRNLSDKSSPVFKASVSMLLIQI